MTPTEKLLEAIDRLLADAVTFGDEAKVSGYILELVRVARGEVKDA